MDKKHIEFLIENVDGVIKFIPENIEVNKKIGLIRAFDIDEKKYIDIYLNFNGFLFKRGLDAYGGQNSIQDFYNFKYFVKDIKELEFINVPENVKIKVQLFEALPINPSRKLFIGDVELENKTETELNVTLFGTPPDIKSIK
jgi:hypothetical protein